LDSIFERAKQATQESSAASANAVARPRRLPSRVVRKLYHVSRHQIGLFVNSTGIKKRLISLRSSDKLGDPVKFNKDDVILVLGAGWHKQSMIDTLSLCKDKCGFKIATLLYDLIPILYPEFFGIGLPGVYVKFIFESLSQSDIVFSISESTKNDVEKFCDKNMIKRPIIKVIRLGDSLEEVENSRRPDGLGKVGDYALAVGTFEVRKNYQVLYQAFKLAQLEGKKMPAIVIVGGNGWLQYDLKSLIEHDITAKNQFVHLSGISDQELAWLYENALFTLSPSVYEGWGLPIAEGLGHGKFSIVSSESSMPEVGGKLTDAVSPYDARAWMDKIHLYYSQPEKLAAKSTKIAKHYKVTDWSQTASIIARKVGEL
jgi:glycosyltransferase involved in cell wall biosynthesis